MYSVLSKDKLEAMVGGCGVGRDYGHMLHPIAHIKARRLAGPTGLMQAGANIGTGYIKCTYTVIIDFGYNIILCTHFLLTQPKALLKLSQQVLWLV